MYDFSSFLLCCFARRHSYAVGFVVGSCSVLQAYISRSLRDELDLEVLALDWSDVQTEGAARRDALPQATSVGVGAKGALTYRTLPINKTSLLAATDEWTAQVSTNTEEQATCARTLPVLFLALHACGSLTLDILRAFTHQVKAPAPSWRPAAALVVGCCYNLLSPEGQFPAEFPDQCSS